MQKVFLGTRSWDLDVGVTDTSFEIVQVKQAMVRAGRQVILLAHSSKWGHVSFAKVAPLSALHTIITDRRLPRDAQTAIERLGIHLIVV